MLRGISRVALCIVALLLFWTVAAPNAHAYIDPGSSSFIIQILIGAAAGAGLAIATFWRRIRAFFAKVFGRGTQEEAAAPPTAAPPKDGVDSPTE